MIRNTCNELESFHFGKKHVCVCEFLLAPVLCLFLDGDEDVSTGVASPLS